MEEKFHKMSDEERATALKIYRARHGLTQSELASKVDCGQTTIVYIENPDNEKYSGHKTRLDILWKLEDLIEEDKENDCQAK